MNRRNFLKGLAMATTVAIIPYELRPIEKIIEVPTEGATYISFDEIIRQTLKNYRPTMVDIITRPDPFWMLLKQKGMINE